MAGPKMLFIPDNRTKVKNASLYPYNCVGIVMACFRDEEDAPVYGTGFLIDKHHVLTAAHYCYNKSRLNYA